MLQCATANPDGRKRTLLIGGGIAKFANFTDVAATFNGIIRALREKVYFSRSQLNCSSMVEIIVSSILILCPPPHSQETK